MTLGNWVVANFWAVFAVVWGVYVSVRIAEWRVTRKGVRRG